MKRSLVFFFVLLFACTPRLHAGTIPLTGTIRTPAGALLNGRIDFTLSYAVARDSSANNVVVASRVSFPVRNGSLPSSAQITPNDILQPGNTTYLAEYFNSYGFKLAENVFYIAGSSFNLGAAIPSTITTSNISFIPTPQNIWTYTASANYPTSAGTIYPANLPNVDNPNLFIGATSSDLVLSPTSPNVAVFGPTSSFIASTAATNGSVASIAAVTGSYVSIASNKTGTGTYLPLAFFTGGAEQMRLLTDGELLVGGSSSSYSGNGLIQTIGINHGFYAVTAASNPSSLAMTINTAVASITSGRSGTGAYVPMAFSANGNETMRLTTGGSAGQSVLVGATTSDVAVSTPSVLTLGSTSGFIAAGATANASVLSMTVVNGSYASLASNKTGTGTYLPLAFFTNGAEAFRVTAGGSAGTSIVVGATTTDVSVSTPSVLTLGSTSGFIAAGATANASVLSMTVVNGLYSSIASNRTGSGTYLPISFFTNATEQMRITTGGGIFAYNLTNANAQDYVCYNTGTKELEQNATTCNLSTEAVKHDIQPLTIGLQEVLRMQPVSFVRNAHPELGPRIGFTAQRTEPIDKRLVTYFQDGTLRSVDYEGYTAVLTKAIQELTDRVHRLESR